MRISKGEREDWSEGAKLLAEATGASANVSAFLRVAAREKLARLKEERAQRKKGK
jgi:hypothetical protein